MWIFKLVQTEQDFTEKCIQSVGEESVDSQLIARHGSLDQLYGSLTVSVTTPFIKLNNSTRKDERRRGMEGKREANSTMWYQGERLSWMANEKLIQLPHPHPHPKMVSALCYRDWALRETFQAPTVFQLDMAFWVIGQEKGGLIEWEEE